MNRTDHTALLTLMAPWLFLVLWCGGFTVAKIGFTGAEPFTLLSIRYGAVVLLLLPFYFARRPKLPATRNEWFHVAWVGFLIQVVYFGAAWVAMNAGGSAATVALITCLGMTVATVWEKRYGVSHHVIVSSLIQYTVGFIFTLPIAWFTETMQVQITPAFLFALTYLVVCNSILAISLLLMMIRQGEVTRVTSLFFLVPPGTAVIALWVLNEPMAPWAWAGMVVAVSGVWLVSRSGIKQ